MDDDDSFPPPPPPYNEADLYEPYEPEPDVVLDLPNAYVDLESISVNQEAANREYESLKNGPNPIQKHSELDHSRHYPNSEEQKSSSLDVSSDSDATIDSNEQFPPPALEGFGDSNAAFNRSTGYEIDAACKDIHDPTETYDHHDRPNMAETRYDAADGMHIKLDQLSPETSKNSDIACDRNNDRYSSSNEGYINPTLDKSSDHDATFVHIEGPEHPLLDMSSDSDSKFTRLESYSLVPTSNKSIDSMENDEMQGGRLKSNDQYTDEDTKSYSSDYVLLSRIGTGPPVPGTQYTYKNCSLVYKDSMNDVKYVWKEGKVQVKPVDSKKATRKSPAGIKLCVGVTILLTIAVVFLLLSLV